VDRGTNGLAMNTSTLFASTWFLQLTTINSNIHAIQGK
jgi:hypothetical protein